MISLSERLRAFSCITANNCGEALRVEAADTIEAQAAEIERHKARIAELEAALQVAVKHHGHGLVNLDQARDALMKKEGE